MSSKARITLDMLTIPGQDTLVCGLLDGTVRLWDVGTATLKQTLRGHTKGVRSVDYSTSHKVLLSAGFDNDVIVWNPSLRRSACACAAN